MSTTRTITSITAALAVAGGLAVSPALAQDRAPSQPSQALVAQSTAKATKATKKAQWPWISVGTWHQVKGRTLTYRYSDAGYQYLARDGRKTFALPGSAGYQINFGDGTSTGGNGTGGAVCLRKGKVVRFKDRTPNLTHRYAKPGKYKVTVTGWYCGTKGNDKLTRSYWVTVR